MGAGRRLNAMEDEDELIEHKPINSARRDSKRTIPTISVRVIPLPLSLPLSLSPSLSPSLSLYISCYIVNTLPTYILKVWSKLEHWDIYGHCLFQLT